MIHHLMKQFVGELTLSMALICCSEESAGHPWCEDTINQISVDDASCLNVTPTELLETVLGEWQCNLTWNEIPEDFASINPDAGTSTLLVSLSHTNGEIREVRSVRKGGGKYDRLACISCFLEIDLDVVLVSTDGGLNENWQVTLNVPNRYQLFWDTTSPEFNGSYSFEPIDNWVYSEQIVSTSFRVNMDGQVNYATGHIYEEAYNAPEVEGYSESNAPLKTTKGIHAIPAEWHCTR